MSTAMKKASVTDMWIKINMNNWKATVTRERADGSRELLTREGKWIPHTLSDDMINAETKIRILNVTPPRKGPPD